ncbi:unnamed protein product [Schistosoma mattheei]|uniref:Uncharacterized protein n=2 Tax=Schistosoma mattheei TaxID=31246 RepID=A0AA85BGL4_9TREM|nr:unnamed protein product [Schistosoma mattheei]
MENHLDHKCNDTEPDSKLFYEKIQRNYSDCNQPWNILGEVIKQVKQECFERVKCLEQENLILQQRYKELEERVLPLTKSLNGQEDLKEYLKLLYSNQMNSTTVNLTSTSYVNMKNSNTMELLTNLLLYTNLSQKDILLNYHQLHKRVAQLERINSLLCSIICDGGFISILDKKLLNYNNTNHETNSTFHSRLKNLSRMNYHSVENLSLYNTTSETTDKHNTISYNNINTTTSTSASTATTTTTATATATITTTTAINTSTTTNNNNSDIKTNDFVQNTRDNYQLSLSNKCTVQHRPTTNRPTVQQPFDSTNMNISQFYKEQQLNSIKFTWIQSKSLPNLKINSKITKKTSLWKNSFNHSLSLLPITNYSIQHFNKQTNFINNLKISPKTKSLPLLSSIDYWKNTLKTSLFNHIHFIHSYSLCNLHRNNNIPLNTMMQVNSYSSNDHKLLINHINSDHNNHKEDHHLKVNHCIEKKISNSIQQPKVYVTSNQSIEYLSNSKQILCRDQKLRYHYPLRSTIFHSNTMKLMNIKKFTKSYDLESHLTYYDTFRKFHNARKNLQFGVFSDTELLTSKFTITSTDDSAIDSCCDDDHNDDDELHSSIDSLYIKNYFIKSNRKRNDVVTSNNNNNNNNNSCHGNSNNQDTNHSNGNRLERISTISDTNVHNNEKYDNHSNEPLNSINIEMKRSVIENTNKNYTSIVSNEKQKSIECNNTIQTLKNINPPEVNNVLECRKHSLDPKSLKNSPEISSDSQCNLKVVAPPPVVIYRRRFQKLPSKRISKFTDRQRSANCKNLEEIKSSVNKTENTMNTTLTVDNQLQTEMKQSNITLSSENSHSNNSQVIKVTSQSNMSTSDLILPEQNKLSLQNVTTRPQHFSNNKTSSSSSSLISISQNSKMRLPQYDGTTTSLPVSPIVSSCSNEMKHFVNDKLIPNYSHCISSSMILKPTTNHINQSCISNTLNSSEIHRLRTISHSPMKSLSNTTSNNQKDFKTNFISSSSSSSSPSSSSSSKSSPTSPILPLNTNISNIISNDNCSLQSSVVDSKTMFTEKIPKIPLPTATPSCSSSSPSSSSSSSNTTAMTDSSLKKFSKIINKPKVHSEKLHRRTIYNNQMTEYNKLTPLLSIPPPIPPRTTSRSQSNQGKMIILKSKCLSVHNSPYMSNLNEVNSLKDTSSCYHNYSLKLHSSPVNHGKFNMNQSQNESLNELNNVSNNNNNRKLSSLSSQWKRPIQSKIATAVETLYKRPIEHSSISTTSISSSSSPSSSSGIIFTTPHDDHHLTDSSKYITNKRCHKQYNNKQNIKDMNNEQIEHRLIYSTNYCNHTIDNTDFHAQLNTTTTITTSITPINENKLIETSYPHQQCALHLQKYSHSYLPQHHHHHHHHHQQHHDHHHHQQQQQQQPLYHSQHSQLFQPNLHYHHHHQQQQHQHTVNDNPTSHNITISDPFIYTKHPSSIYTINKLLNNK